jgi:hypothetical protein
MSTFGELLREMPLPVKTDHWAADTRGRTRAEAYPQVVVPPAVSVREQQIRGLVEQLFFRHESGRVRNACFAPIEESPQTGAICFDVANALAGEGKYDVGLIDARIEGTLLQEELELDVPSHARGSCVLAPRLWLVPRQSWRKEPDRQLVMERDLERLRDFMTEFDFSILCCAPASWLTARIAQNCDGLVLMLTANKTRRLVAAQIKELLGKARIPILGTVLAERRLPVPQGLYRKL